MIHKIANLLRDEISSLNFVDVCVGIAKPVPIKVPQDEGFVEKRIPVAYHLSTDACDPDELRQLVPDDKKMSIHFWEDQGINLEDEDTYYLYSQASLRLVSWWNLPLINSSYTDTSLLVSTLIATIPDRLDNTDYLIQILVQFAGAEPEGAGVVSQYNFDEAEDQFTTFPYVYTGLNYRVNFAFPKNSTCLDDVILNPSICP